MTEPWLDAGANGIGHTNVNLIIRKFPSMILVLKDPSLQQIFEHVNKKNWVFATTPDVWIPKLLLPDVVKLCFKLTLFDSTEFIVWNI